jgi:hypothetical protein
MATGKILTDYICIFHFEKITSFRHNIDVHIAEQNTSDIILIDMHRPFDAIELTGGVGMPHYVSRRGLATLIDEPTLEYFGNRDAEKAAPAQGLHKSRYIFSTSMFPIRQTAGDTYEYVVWKDRTPWESHEKILKDICPEYLVARVKKQSKNEMIYEITVK